MALRARNLSRRAGAVRLPSLVAVLVVLVVTAGSSVSPAPEAALQSSSADVAVRQGSAGEVSTSAPMRRWGAGSTIRFTIDPDGAPAGAVEAIERAVATWSGTGIDVIFEYEGQSDGGGLVADLVNTVSWLDPGEATVPFVARTVVHWYDDDPDRIVGFDLVFNRDHPFSVGEVDGAWDVETVALHEFGHVLGLGHADADRVVRVMRPRIEAGELDHTLSLADLRVLRSFYGDSVHIPSGGLFRPQDEGVRVIAVEDRSASSDGGAAEVTRGLFDPPADPAGGGPASGEPIVPAEVIVAVGEGLFS